MEDNRPPLRMRIIWRGGENARIEDQGIVFQSSKLIDDSDISWLAILADPFRLSDFSGLF